MTNQEFEALCAKEGQLWQEMTDLERPYKSKQAEWSVLWNQKQREEQRREIVAEMARDSKSTQTTHPQLTGSVAASGEVW